MDILERVRADFGTVGTKRQREVALEMGVPWSTLRKVLDSNTENPQYRTVENIRAYYARKRPRKAG